MRFLFVRSRLNIAQTFHSMDYHSSTKPAVIPLQARSIVLVLVLRRAGKPLKTSYSNLLLGLSLLSSGHDFPLSFICLPAEPTSVAHQSASIVSVSLTEDDLSTLQHPIPDPLFQTFGALHSMDLIVHSILFQLRIQPQRHETLFRLHGFWNQREPDERRQCLNWLSYSHGQRPAMHLTACSQTCVCIRSRP